MNEFQQQILQKIEQIALKLENFKTNNLELTKSKEELEAKVNYLERKEPTLGSIEHAEWRQKMDEISSLAEIMISKQRHGPTGNVKVEFEAMYTKFKNLENK